MKKLLLLTLLLFVLTVTVAGCGGEKKTGEGKIELPYTQTLEKFGIQGKVVLERRPQRVATLSFTPVMALYEMGIPQVAVPTNRISKWPEDLLQNAKQMSTAMASNLDIESVVALQPDLVIIPYHAKDKYGKILEGQKIPVYYVDAGPAMSYQSVKEQTEVLVNAFGRGTDAGKKIMERFSALEKRMEAKREANRGKKVMILLSSPPQHYIQGVNANLGSMMALLGYTNVFEGLDIKNSMTLLDKEKALSYQPDVIVSVGMGTAEEHQANMEKDFAKNPEYWNQISAVKEGRVVYLPSRYAISSGIGVTEDINELMDRMEKKNL